MNDERRRNHESESESESELLYDWLFTDNQFNFANQLNVPFHNFGVNRLQITASNISSSIPCPSIAAETCATFVATLWFPQAYPLLRKHA
jgi:hypothetical protein